MPPWPSMQRVQASLSALEPQVAGHAPELFALLADPALYRIEGEPPVSLAWLRERLARLEARTSPDGTQAWLNWVVRLPSGEAAGYVQATLHADGRAAVAYVLGSAYWHKGIATDAVQAMLRELQERWGLTQPYAVLKARNEASRRLLERLGFRPAQPGQLRRLSLEADEIAMLRP